MEKKPKKKHGKEGKKLKLRHSCIAPKTTGITSTGGTGDVGCGICTCAVPAEAPAPSPVRVLLDVVVGGRPVEETGIEGLALLPPGKHPGDGAKAHLLFLLFPFLVFQVF